MRASPPCKQDSVGEATPRTRLTVCVSYLDGVLVSAYVPNIIFDTEKHNTGSAKEKNG